MTNKLSEQQKNIILDSFLDDGYIDLVGTEMDGKVFVYQCKSCKQKPQEHRDDCPYKLLAESLGISI